MPDAKLWDLETPYLYQLHAAVLVNGTHRPPCAAVRYAQLYAHRKSAAQGMFYLNGAPSVCAGPIRWALSSRTCCAAIFRS
ncbi:MAG: hypothetical protein ACLTGM_07250 [Oscillospiraceae bacterium]